MAAAIAMAAMADVAGRRKMAEFFFLSAVGVGLTRPNPTRKLNENHDPPTFQNAAATLEASTQRDLGTSHDPCNQPRNQPRVTRCTQQPAATTHGVNGGDEHGVNDGDANGEDDPEPRPRLILVGGPKPFFCFCCLTPLFYVCSFFFSVFLFDTPLLLSTVPFLIFFSI